ncbi:MAG: hypothetical protein WBX25_24815 [Rhodomicrobium sp.]
MLKPEICSRCSFFERGAQTANEFFAVDATVSIAIRPKLTMNAGEDMKLIKCVIERALGISVMATSPF